MNAEQLITDLNARGVRLWAEDGRIRFRGPRGIVNDDRRELLREHRDEILSVLNRPADPPAALLRPGADRFAPFPLTPVQTAYLLGRTDAFPYGNVACHAYLELVWDADVDPERITRSWTRLVERHEMLRAIVHPDGHQQVQAQVRATQVPVDDLRGLAPAARQRRLDGVRAELGRRTGRDPREWPLVQPHVSRTDDAVLMHLSVDLLVVDYAGLQLLLSQLRRQVADPAAVVTAATPSFRDCVLARRALTASADYERDRSYWWRRLDELPPAPELPMTEHDPMTVGARFHRLADSLDPDSWTRLRKLAAQHGVTPTSAVLAAYAETIGRWSRHPRFTLNLPTFDRTGMPAGAAAVVGDFTTIELLAVDLSEPASALDRIKEISGQLLEDLAHPLCSGTELLGELSRRRGGSGTGGRDVALAPVVFTGAPAGVEEDVADTGGRIVAALTQTPQVWIDCQALPGADGLALSWDVRDGVLPDGLAGDAFAAFTTAVRTLAGDEQAWQRPYEIALPESQAQCRQRVNNTAAAVPAGLLHEPILVAAGRNPDAPAVIAGDRTLSYDELVRRADAVAQRLLADGLRAGDRVGVIAERGWEQIVAVLGTLLAGGAYVPIDTVQPPARRDTILGDAGITQVLTQHRLAGDDVGWRAAARRTVISAVGPSDNRPDADASGVAPDQLAYVIYTSGSTGTPKGAMLSHRAALNTVADINTRYGVASSDRMLGLAGLGFDLSVYDIFGVLGAGAALVLPDPARRDDPSHWAALIARHGVTLWNSVPAQAQMLENYLRAAAADTDSEPLPQHTLRLALLSGDWIPVTLPDALRDLLPDLQVVSLGGATEAAIWSIHHMIDQVDHSRPSIPYGTPLTNQRFAVRDTLLRDRPDWVPGELYIEGTGVALGYLGDVERTNERFGTDPVTGERWYRTGDLGRYHPDGSIEFLGREDAQVKIRGYRIELAEIESALLTHPDVAACAVQVSDTGGSRQLAGFVQAERMAAPTPDSAAADRALAALRDASAELDLAELTTFLDAFDDYALQLIEQTLAAAGVLSDPARAWSATQAAAALRATGAHTVVVRRWLRTLAVRGRITGDSDQYRGELSVRPAELHKSWQRVEAAERRIRWSAELLRHVQASGARLAELISGELDIAELLYPGAPADAIGAAYRDNLGVRLLNRAITAALTDISDRHDTGEPLRILEVRGGVGGTTDHLVPALARYDVEYVFSDPSMFFVGEARERHADFDWVRFTGFDPAADPLEQGQRPNSYDVVICSNGLHGVPDVPATLRHLQDLLVPGGQLLLVESTREDNPPLMVATDFMELRAGGPRDGRRAQDALLWTAPQWQAMLHELGARDVRQAPAAEDPLSGLGQHLFLARVKSDRARLTAGKLSEHAASRLPEYMVPARWQLLDALPTTANGKINRSALQRLAGTGEDQRTVAAVADEPRDDIEQRLAGLWAELLGRPRVGRDEDFFALGGDSLLVARLVGKMREHLPEIVDLEWDVVLRHLLRRPTVAGLAGYVRSVAGSEHPGASGTAMPALSLLSGSGSDPATVLVHAGIGTIMPYRSLMTEIRRRSRGTGSLVGLEIPDLDGFLDAEPTGLIDRMGADYARELLATGTRTFHVVGYCLGGLVATEVARALTEAGADVASFTAISSHSPAFRLDDELLSEYSFAMMVGINPADLGFPCDQWRMAAAGAQVLARTPGVMAAGGYASLDGEFADVGEAFRELEQVPRSQRVARMCEVVPPSVGSYTPEQMMRFFRTFRQSVFAITRYRPDPYAGDITFLRHSGAYPFPGSKEAVTDYWEDLTLGELTIIDVPGDHYDCLSAEHAPGLLTLLAQITGGAVTA